MSYVLDDLDLFKSKLEFYRDNYFKVDSKDKWKRKAIDTALDTVYELIDSVHTEEEVDDILAEME